MRSPSTVLTKAHAQLISSPCRVLLTTSLSQFIKTKLGDVAQCFAGLDGNVCASESDSKATGCPMYISLNPQSGVLRCPTIRASIWAQTASCKDNHAQDRDIDFWKFLQHLHEPTSLEGRQWKEAT